MTSYIVVFGLIVVVVLVVVLVALGMRASRAAREDDDWMDDDAQQPARGYRGAPADEMAGDEYATGYDNASYGPGQQQDPAFDRRVAGGPLAAAASPMPAPVPSPPQAQAAPAPPPPSGQASDEMEDDDYWATITFDKPKFPWQHDSAPEKTEAELAADPLNNQGQQAEPPMPAERPAAMMTQPVSMGEHGRGGGTGPQAMPSPPPSFSPAAQYGGDPSSTSTDQPAIAGDGGLLGTGAQSMYGNDQSPYGGGNDQSPYGGGQDQSPYGSQDQSSYGGQDQGSPYGSQDQQPAAAAYGSQDPYGSQDSYGGGSQDSYGSSSQDPYGSQDPSPSSPYGLGDQSPYGTQDQQPAAAFGSQSPYGGAGDPLSGGPLSGGPSVPSRQDGYNSPGDPRVSDPLGLPLGRTEEPARGGYGDTGGNQLPPSSDTDSNKLPTVDELLQRIQTSRAGSGPGAGSARPSEPEPSYGSGLNDPLGDPLGTGGGSSFGNTGGWSSDTSGGGQGGGGFSGLSGSSFGSGAAGAGGGGGQDGYPSAPAYGDSAPRYDDPLGGGGGGRDSYGSFGGGSGNGGGDPTSTGEPGRYSDFSGSSYNGGGDPLGAPTESGPPGGGFGDPGATQRFDNNGYFGSQQQGYGSQQGGGAGDGGQYGSYGNGNGGGNGNGNGSAPRQQQHDDWESHRDYRR
ncbi:hypothetical protein J4573_42855 [Actinomadura barringtoniae]|uniref:Uncharacterized protein n=1 Tax=Actinomadura barringtoniae TaxID=1427535 RepID=A0A939TBU2_9ACTN|nr:hypothetical protein [Actinomadura barringtoniae]MBO2453892.1 hypothetical protein [Actinomadura barringtoniae]